MMISGTFTPPDDLQPAIDALSDVGRQYLIILIEDNGGTIEPWMIAKAADHERGEDATTIQYPTAQ